MLYILYSILEILILVLNCYLSEKTFGKKINLVSIYNFSWLFLSVIAICGFYGLYRPSYDALTCIIISTCIFSISSLFLYWKFKRKRITKADLNIPIVNKSYTLLSLLIIIAIAYELYFAIKMIPFYLAGNWWLARNSYLVTKTSTIYTTQQALISQWIMYPMINASTILSAYYIVERKPKKILFFLSTFGQVANVFATGGRSALFRAVMIYAFAYMAGVSKTNQLKRMIKKAPKWIKGLFLLGVITLIYITTQRRVGSNHTTILENILVYFCGPFIYLGIILKNPRSFALGSSYLYGRATFGFITTPLEIIYSRLARKQYLGADHVVTEYASQYFSLSDTVRGNAVTTSLYPFMKAYGIAGIALGPLFFSIIATIPEICKRNTKNNKLFWSCICIYMYFVAFFSEWEYTLLFPSSFMTMFIIFLATYNHKMKVKSS